MIGPDGPKLLSKLGGLKYRRFGEMIGPDGPKLLSKLGGLNLPLRSAGLFSFFSPVERKLVHGFSPTLPRPFLQRSFAIRIRAIFRCLTDSVDPHRKKYCLDRNLRGHYRSISGRAQPMTLLAIFRSLTTPAPAERTPNPLLMKDCEYISVHWLSSHITVSTQRFMPAISSSRR